MNISAWLQRWDAISYLCSLKVSSFVWGFFHNTKQTLSLLLYILGQICLLWIIVIANSNVKYYPFWKIYTRVFILSTYKGLQTWASLRCCDVIELPPVPIFIIFLALFITLFIYLLLLCLMVSMFLFWLVSLYQFAL